jgi:comEA protein
MKKLTFFLLSFLFVFSLTFMPQLAFSQEAGTEGVGKGKEAEKGTTPVTTGTEKGQEPVTKGVAKGKADVETKGAEPVKVNINTATAEELIQIKGIGKTIASRIIEHRQKIGKFNSIEELKDVKGIGDKLFLKIKDQLTL